VRELLNTLYVTTPYAYLHLENDTVRVEVDRELKLRAPLMHIGSIVVFGDTLISPALIARCAEDRRSIVFLSHTGRFVARVEGPVGGNVLLRRAQHLALSDYDRRLSIARNILAGKLRNSRHVILRAARDTPDADESRRLREAASWIDDILRRLPERVDLDMLRGDEGEAGREYFSVFPMMIRGDRTTFGMAGRSRRPPLDRTNALLSFLYTLLRADCNAALEGVGLDPQVGFLHALRPGRPALALDLMEELRPILADRLALTLINLKQLQADDFDVHEGGAVYLNDRGRKTVIVAYQKRKEDEVDHRVVGKKVPLGLVPHLQARLLARHLRDDLRHYLPFLMR
jgi:CRISPR-associated protein Cas1